MQSLALDAETISSRVDTLYLSYQQDLEEAEIELRDYLNILDANEQKVKIRVLQLLGIIKKYQGDYEESIKHHKRILMINKILKNDQVAIDAYLDLAATFKANSDFNKSFLYLDSSLIVARNANDNVRIANIRLVLGNLWQAQAGNEEKALASFWLGLKRLNTDPDKKTKASLCMNIANTYSSLQQIDSSLHYYRLAQVRFRKLNDISNLAKGYNNIGIVYLELKLLDSSKIYFEKAIVETEKIENINFQAILYRNLSILSDELGEPDKGLAYIRKALRDKENLELGNVELLYSDISYYLETAGRYDSALFYNKELNLYRDSINKAEKFLQIQELEVKYENERLRSEKLEAIGISEKTKAENRLLMLVAIIMTLLFILAGFGYVLVRQRLQTKTLLTEKNEVIHQQKLNDLMREKQIERMTALMEGQEKERTRVAQELHDSIGALLATLKHHFQLIEGKIGKNDEKYQKAYSLLDKASSEVRRISHNIASNVLSKFGLVAALQDLAEEITSAEKTEVKVFATGLEERLDNSVEIHLFRVVQELVSNALKHAKATVITIQFTMHDNELNLMVEDNGVGFDVKKVELSDGMGMENLKARVKHLKGEIDIDSNPGNGTTVIVNVPIAKA